MKKILGHKGRDNTMKLVMFSEQLINKDNPMNRAMENIIKQKDMKIGYISSTSDLSKKYYHEVKSYYENFGVKKILYFDLGKTYNESLMDELLSCNAIHLSGENTEKFIELLRSRGFQKILIQYAKDGGILIGSSAGSIIMSSSIEIINYIGEKTTIGNKEALNLVDFEFVPHWGENKDNLYKIIDYSIKKENPIYCFKDGYGVIINGDTMDFYGDVTKIHKGNVSLLHGNVKLF